MSVMQRLLRTVRILLLALGALVVMMAMSSSPALAVGTPKWQITTFANPTVFVPFEGTSDAF